MSVSSPFRPALALILAGLLTLSVLPSAPACAVAAEDAVQYFPLMHPDEKTLAEWVKAYDSAARTESFSTLRPAALSGGSIDLLPHMVHVPSERSQGACGNCWAWAGTGCMEIALSVQDGIRDRLSVQVVNSCRSVIGKYCCQGGWLSDFARFYDIMGFCLPWANENADWQDLSGGCTVPCDTIAIEPHYNVAGIEALTIPTLISQDVPTRSVAIANIKSVLDSGRGVWFAFFAPSEGWQQFYSFWSSQCESTVANLDLMCSGTTNGGGHAVLCVGYDDTDPDNRYWIMLNSWGTAGGNRPNGLFRINMDMDYNAHCGINAFYWQALDVQFRYPPTVETGAASIVAASSATVQGTVTNDSGTAVEVGFEFGTIMGGAYPLATPWQSGFFSSDVFEAELSDLQPGTRYYYRARARNSGGIANGVEHTFFTTPAAPANFRADAFGQECVELAWSRGRGATDTVVWGKKDSLPIAPGDGYLVYEGPDTAASDPGREPGSAYHYRAWSVYNNAAVPESLMSDEWSEDCAHTIGNGVWMVGDVNLDARVTPADAVSILRFAMGLEELSPEAFRVAQTYSAGRVTPANASHILRFSMDPTGALGVLTEPIWLLPDDDGLLNPLCPCAN